MRTVVFAMGIASLAGIGCARTVSRYSVSADTVSQLRSIGGAVNVGAFTSKRRPDGSEIGCRMVGPIQTPDNETYSQYVRNALISELQMAQVFSKDAPVTITGTIDQLDFSSTDGQWTIGLTVVSSNGNSVHVNETYDFPTSFFGEQACNQTAQAFMPAVQDLIAKLVRAPGFKDLVGAKMAATATVSTKSFAPQTAAKPTPAAASPASKVRGK